MLDVYLPDSCLQGEELPAHVLWLQSERVEVTVSFPESLELVAIFNAPRRGIKMSGDNVFEANQFEVNGYLGLVFRSKLLPERRARATVIFKVQRGDGLPSREIVRETILFRPLVQIESVPKSIRIDYDSNRRAYSVSDRIRLRNIGDGTAIVHVVASANSEFDQGPPSGILEFREAFCTDVAIKLNVLAGEFPHLAPLFQEFVVLLREPPTLAKETLARMKSLFKKLDESLEADEDASDGFAAAIVTSIVKNIQLITELRSFVEYLNSIGAGRVQLIGSLDVLKPRQKVGRLELEIEMTDLAYNEYEPLHLPEISISCDGKAEIPIHLLIDWRQIESGRKSSAT